MADTFKFPCVLSPLAAPLGALTVEAGASPLPEAVWYTATEPGDGLAYRFPAGLLADAQYLTCDLLVEGTRLVVFTITLREGETGSEFRYLFAALNQCGARLRLPLEAVNQNRWQFPREGALLKPMCAGDRVDLRRVDRMTLTVLRKSEHPARWCQTAVRAVLEAPPLLDAPVLPAGPLVDAFGQNTLYEWPGKTKSEAELVERLRGQRADAPAQRWPRDFSRWGGWLGKQVEATGNFRTHFDGERWWLVDPEGYLFWSTGLDCVRPEVSSAYVGLETALAWLPEDNGPYRAAFKPVDTPHRTVNYLMTNLYRAFGAEWKEAWATTILGELRAAGFNTIANWSDWETARAAGFPYVRPLEFTPARTPYVFRDFPDVFAPTFAEDAADYARQLAETADDPALIGYFLMNEPTWGFASETPAAGMLFATEGGPCRARFAEFLQERYGSDAALAAAWGLPVTLAALREGRWETALTPVAQADCAAFSTVMVDRLYGGLSAACKQVDPRHLNLGARYYTVPPDWVVGGMQSFDVLSMNCYRERVPAEEYARLYARLQRPIMVGEWHFGALDVGLPGSGIGHVRDQQARGQAYRVYLEDAAAKPWCVGAHYFTLYDESVLGRFDGENWNIGFYDVCQRPYAPLVEAARASHERLYAVASGASAPYDDAPEYLPLLFL